MAILKQGMHSSLPVSSIWKLNLAIVEMREEETGKAEIFMCSFKIKIIDLDHIKSFIWTFSSLSLYGLTRSETNLVDRLGNN